MGRDELRIVTHFTVGPNVLYSRPQQVRHGTRLHDEFGACGSTPMLALASSSSLGLLPCPATRWGATTAADRPASIRSPEDFPRPLHAPAVPDETEWLRDNADSIMAALQEAGALHLRGFRLPRTKTGFRSFCEALPLQPCADPLASIGVRSLLSPSDGIYEAVNAPALSGTFIGLHNDATWKLTAPVAAFVCFQRAETGGDFLVADGRRILSELEPSVVAKLCERKVSVRVAALNAAPLLRLAGPLREPVSRFVAAAVSALLGAAVPLGLVVAWADDGHTLQILERPKPPLNRHPATGEPTFFSSLHSQSQHLQRRRSSSTLGSVAATDAFFGDLQPIKHAELEHIDEVIMRNAKRVAMQPGEVVLLDSYQVLHGREPFTGEREHGVMWLTDPADAAPADGGGDGSVLSRAINRLAVKRGG